MDISIGKITIKSEDIAELLFLEFAKGQRSLVCLAYNHAGFRMREWDIPMGEYTLDYASPQDYERHYAEIMAQGTPGDAFTRTEEDVPLVHLLMPGEYVLPHGLPIYTQVHAIKYCAVWWQMHKDALAEMD